MKIAVVVKGSRASGQPGPMCIACSNTRTFWVHSEAGPSLRNMTDMPEGEVRILACGRCRSHHSIIMALVD